MSSLVFILFTMMFNNSFPTHGNIVMFQDTKAEKSKRASVPEKVERVSISIHHVLQYHAPFTEAPFSFLLGPLISLQFLHQLSHRDAWIYPVMLSTLSIIWFVSPISLPFQNPVPLPTLQEQLYYLFLGVAVITISPLKYADTFSDTKDSSSHQQGRGRRRRGRS